MEVSKIRNRRKVRPLVIAQVASEHPTNCLFPRLAARGRSAAGESIERYGQCIWRIALACEDSPHDSEDLAGKLFEAIWKNAGRFKTGNISDDRAVSIILTAELLFLGLSPRRKRRLNRSVEIAGSR